MAHLGAMLGYVGPSGRHLGATWRQDEAQERQDEPRWRTGAPRRGKIAELRLRELLQGGCNPCNDTQPEKLGSPKNPELGLQNWDSSMDLQTPTPAGTGSGKLDPGKLEDWKTGPSALHCTRICASGTVAAWIYIYIEREKEGEKKRERERESDR